MSSVTFERLAQKFEVLPEQENQKEEDRQEESTIGHVLLER
jgi:hypothetical protein